MAHVRIPLCQTQRKFLHAVLEDDGARVIGFGGARGGGKTFVSCLGMCLRRLKYAKTKGLMLRRTQGAADQNLKTEIEKVLYDVLHLPAGSVRYYKADKTFVFPNGSSIKMGYCKLEEDWQQYQGVEYADICFEEATQFPEDAWIKISGSNRAGNPRCRPKRWVTCNPGGQGHGWVKRRFVAEETRGKRTAWIGSRLRDCPATLESNPGYALTVLRDLDEPTRKMWEDGDWDAVAGAYFTLRPVHLQEIEVPYWARWFAGVDYGHAAPFCVLWMAKWKTSDGRFRAHVVKELYQANLHLDEQAIQALEIERALREGRRMNAHSVLYYADPAVAKRVESVSTEAGRTIRTTWTRYKWNVLPAHTNARVPSLQLIKYLLKAGILTLDPSCKALISEMQSAVYEGSPGPPKGEDLQQGPGVPDHAIDALRYVCASTFGIGFAERQKGAYEFGASDAPVLRLVAA